MQIFYIGISKSWKTRVLRAIAARNKSRKRGRSAVRACVYTSVVRVHANLSSAEVWWIDRRKKDDSLGSDFRSINAKKKLLKKNGSLLAAVVVRDARNGLTTQITVAAAVAAAAADFEGEEEILLACSIA